MGFLRPKDRAERLFISSKLWLFKLVLGWPKQPKEVIEALSSLGVF